VAGSFLTEFEFLVKITVKNNLFETQTVSALCDISSEFQNPYYFILVFCKSVAWFLSLLPQNSGKKIFFPQNFTNQIKNLINYLPKLFSLTVNH
jgi:hypothetical protein